MNPELSKQAYPVETRESLLESVIMSTLERSSDSLQRELKPSSAAQHALEIYRLTPDLQKCSPESIATAVLEASQLGLSLNLYLGHAYLVPFKGQCKLIIGYRGFIELMMRTGQVKAVRSYIVYSGDRFAAQYGSSPEITHIPAAEKDRGEWRACYCLVSFADGSTEFELMYRDEIEKIRERSASYRFGGPWKTDPDEMVKKTPIRRIAKRIRLSVNDFSIQAAAVREEYREFEVGEERPSLVKPRRIQSNQNEHSEDAPGVADARITAEQAKKLCDKAISSGWKVDELKQYMLAKYKAEKSTHLTVSQAADFERVISEGT